MSPRRELLLAMHEGLMAARPRSSQFLCHLLDYALCDKPLLESAGAELFKEIQAGIGDRVTLECWVVQKTGMGENWLHNTYGQAMRLAWLDKMLEGTPT